MKYGDIYREITDRTAVPATVEEIWQTISKNRNDANESKVKNYGSNLTVQEGSVFAHKSYSTNIDSYLK